MLNFNHLYYFHVTAVAGSLKAASERLGVTQSTVSEQIRALERSLGVQLFERVPTGLRLTAAGRDVYEHTTPMFLAGERLVEVLGKSESPPMVLLRVGVSAAISRTIAADFLMPLLTVENCRPCIRAGDFAELMRDLRSNQLDLVIAETEQRDATGGGIQSSLVSRPTLVAVTSPDVQPRDSWENLALLEYRASSAFHWEVEAFLKEKDLRPKCAGELDDAFLMLEAVIRGGFAAFVPFSVARSALRENKVRTVATIQSQEAGIYALYPSEDRFQLARQAVERLIDAAREGSDDE